MKKLVLSFGLLCLLVSCGKDTKKKDKETIAPPPPPAILLADNSFKAVPMPTTLITKDTFPTDSTKINGWVAKSKATNNIETNSDIINHGWAIWKALTEVTTQKDNDQALRRFETWYTPNDIINAYKLRKEHSTAKLTNVKRNLGELQKLNQLHGQTAAISLEDQGVVGFVKYDPTAAEHIYKNDLFYASVLKKMLQTNKIVNIPDFPNGGVALKPVFAALDSINPATGLYVIPSWPGNGGNPNRPFGPGAWDHYVSVTIDGKTDVAKKTYSIKDFVHFKLDAAQAKVVGGKPGDYAILQGMHVTTRETKRWTWQTFWWSEFHDNPQSPSSKTIADLRPKEELDQGANHYAMGIAYSTIDPAQPYNGGSGAQGTSLYAYNPYLEAGFDTSTFTKANDTVQKYYKNDPNYQKVGGVLNQYGMQTNCMSCHGQARFIPGLYGGNGHFYLTDQYFELDAPYFANTVKLDFTWSIQGNLIDDNEKPLGN